MTPLQKAQEAANALSIQDLSAHRAYVTKMLEERTRASIRIGDLVECEFSGGEVIRFRVERVNVKTLSGKEVGGRHRPLRRSA